MKENTITNITVHVRETLLEARRISGREIEDWGSNLLPMPSLKGANTSSADLKVISLYLTFVIGQTQKKILF